MHKVNICSHGVFLTWDLELSIQQSASMVTPEKPPGKARNASGRVETSLDDYGIPRDCVVGSPPSRLEDSRFYKYIQLTRHCPVTGPLWLRTMVTLHLCTESGINPIPIWVIVMALMVIKLSFGKKTMWFQVPVKGSGVASSVVFLSPGGKATETLCWGKFFGRIWKLQLKQERYFLGIYEYCQWSIYKDSRLSGFWDSELQVIRWRQSGSPDLQIKKTFFI